MEFRSCQRKERSGSAPGSGRDGRKGGRGGARDGVKYGLVRFGPKQRRTKRRAWEKLGEREAKKRARETRGGRTAGVLLEAGEEDIAEVDAPELGEERGRAGAAGGLERGEGCAGGQRPLPKQLPPDNRTHRPARPPLLSAAARSSRGCALYRASRSSGLAR
eukprot:920533-Rhodomonas_salina.1